MTRNLFISKLGRHFPASTRKNDFKKTRDCRRARLIYAIRERSASFPCHIRYISALLRPPLVFYYEEPFFRSFRSYKTQDGTILFLIYVTRPVFSCESQVFLSLTILCPKTGSDRFFRFPAFSFCLQSVCIDILRPRLLPAGCFAVPLSGQNVTCKFLFSKHL